MKSSKDSKWLHAQLNGPAISPLEERVLRMRHGVGLRVNARLEDASNGQADLQQSLSRMEQAVLQGAPASATRRCRARLHLVTPPK
jgi:hypothetical protein